MTIRKPDANFAMPWLHAGAPERENGMPFAHSPVMAATYHLAGDPAGTADGYGRMNNPTWRSLETVLGAMEGGEALAFPSGMAAITAAIMPFAKPGARLVLPKDGYYTVRSLVETFLVPLGIEAHYVETRDMAEADLQGAAVVWIETPSNPGLDLCDIALVSAKARAAGAVVICDNTTMTPLGQRCLDLGANLVVSADTKAMNGHSDVLMGHVAGRDADLLEQVRRWRTLSGSIPGAMEAWLVLRGLQTVEVRLERMWANAAAVAAAIEGHTALVDLRFPGLKSDPGHAIASRQMQHFGSLVTMTFADGARATRFLDALAHVYEATSFGGTHSMAERRARWDASVHPGLVRFSAGCEPTAALVADVVRALDAAAKD